MKRSKTNLTDIILEMTVTATGTGTSSFSAGEGEQTASKYSFKKKRKKSLDEQIDVEYTPEKRQEIYTQYEKEYSNAKGIVERFINKFKGLTIDDLISNLPEAEKLRSAADKMYNTCSKREDLLTEMADTYYDEGDKQEESKFNALSYKYYQLGVVSYDIEDSLGDIVNTFEKILDSRRSKTPFEIK